MWKLLIANPIHRQRRRPEGWSLHHHQQQYYNHHVDVGRNAISTAAIQPAFIILVYRIFIIISKMAAP